MRLHVVFPIVIATCFLVISPSLAGEDAAKPSHSEPVSTTKVSEWRTLANSRMGCSSPEVLVEARQLEFSGGRVAADKFQLEKLRNGECKLLPSGKAQVEAASPDGQEPKQLCITPVNYGKCWWVPDEFLE